MCTDTAYIQRDMFRDIEMQTSQTSADVIVSPCMCVQLLTWRTCRVTQRSTSTLPRLLSSSPAQHPGTWLTLVQSEKCGTERVNHCSAFGCEPGTADVPVNDSNKRRVIATWPITLQVMRSYELLRCRHASHDDGLFACKGTCNCAYFLWISTIHWIELTAAFKQESIRETC